MAYKYNHEDYAEFCGLAQAALQLEAGLLASGSLERLTTMESYWHPTGFAVFYLNDEHRLGKLRLHIWPESERIVRPDNAPIHTHVWHLCSLVLTGTYSETIYDTLETPSLLGTEYSSAVIDYMVDRNTLRYAGVSQLNKISKIVAGRGEFHKVPARVPHETQVPNDKFVATLLITSPPVTDQAIMYSPSKIFASSYQRPALTLSQKTSLVRRLNSELGN